MKNNFFSSIIKSVAKKREKEKSAPQFPLQELRRTIGIHGDTLLFFLALVVLAAIPLNFGKKGTITGAQIFRSTPSLVFTQWWEGEPEHGVLLELIDEFESRHGGIKVVLDTVPYEELRRDLFDLPEDASLGHTFPADILALDPLWVPELQRRGIIENIWAGTALSERRYTQAAGEPVLLSFIDVLYYNLEILREAGFTRPPKTRDEFLDYSRAVTGEKRWGLALGLNCSRGMYDDVFPWMWAAGGQLLTDGKPALDSRQVIEGLLFLASLNEGGFIVPGAFSADAGKKLDDFISGRAVFMIAPARDITFIREHMGSDAFSVSSVPSPDNYAGKTLYGSAGWTVALNPATVLNEEALLFMDFLAEKASMLSEKIPAIPGYGAPAPAQDPVYSKVWDIAIAGESARDFSGLPWIILEETFREELFNLFTGKNTPAETAGAIQKRWEAALSSLN